MDLQFFYGLFKAASTFVVVFGYVGLLWLGMNRITPFDDHRELFEKNNVAYLLQRAGLCSAQVIAMLAVVPDFDLDHPWWSLLWLALEGLWVFVALLATVFLIDRAFMPKVRNRQMLLEGNRAIGIVEAASYIGIGFLLNGSLTGSADSVLLSILSTVVFFILGLGFVVLVFWIHEWITPYNLRNRLTSGDTAAALELAGVLLAASIVTRVGVTGDFTTWGEGIMWFLVTAVISIILLYAGRWVTNRLVLKQHSVREVQKEGTSLTAAAALQGVIPVLVAFVVASIMENVV
jgi:uncharacterized membrane protein YjfL (UPF0719 family)